MVIQLITTKGIKINIWRWLWPKELINLRSSLNLFMKGLPNALGKFWYAYLISKGRNKTYSFIFFKGAFITRIIKITFILWYLFQITPCLWKFVWSALHFYHSLLHCNLLYLEYNLLFLLHTVGFCKNFRKMSFLF